MMKRPGHRVLYCIIAVMIAGCASSAPSRFYTLNPTGTPADIPQADVSVSVGPVSVPVVVDRQQIVVRTGPNEVSIKEYDRWASPLKDEIVRVLVENLASMLGTTQVTLFPQTAAAENSYRTVIDIVRFDSEPGKAAILDAFWTVSLSKSGKSYRGRTTLTEAIQGNGYAALAAAHSRALGRLSGDIAGKIREMEARKP